MKKQLPVKVEVILYKYENRSLMFLLIKRSLDDSEFWQPITGTVETNEGVLDCASRELAEETGIINPFLTFKPVYRFTWDKQGQTIEEFVYAAETNNCDVILSSEHTDYRWCTYKEAVKLLIHKDNRIALARVNALLQKDQ